VPSENQKTPVSEVTLPPVADPHIPAILDWFEAPHVRRWWGDPRVNASELIWHRKAPPPSGCRTVCLSETPVGYIQWTDFKAYFGTMAYGLPAGTIDIDILIGETDLTGKGIGPRAMTQTINLILSQGAAPLLSVFVSSKNGAAIRAYASIGFEKKQTIETDAGGVEWLMTLDPSRWSARDGD